LFGNGRHDLPQADFHFIDGLNRPVFECQVKLCACFSFTLQITQHPHLSPIPAPHSPGSAGAVPAKVCAIGREDLIDKSRTAKDRSIGQVADPAAQLRGQADLPTSAREAPLTFSPIQTNLPDH